MKTINVDMGAFLRSVTEQLDNGPMRRYGTVRIDLTDRVIWFPENWLENLLRTINGVFYRCYGGWVMELELGEFDVYTGRVAFVPADMLVHTAKIDRLDKSTERGKEHD